MLYKTFFSLAYVKYTSFCCYTQQKSELEEKEKENDWEKKLCEKQNHFVCFFTAEQKLFFIFKMIKKRTNDDEAAKEKKSKWIRSNAQLNLRFQLTVNIHGTGIYVCISPARKIFKLNVFILPHPSSHAILRSLVYVVLDQIWPFHSLHTLSDSLIHSLKRAKQLVSQPATQPNLAHNRHSTCLVCITSI